MIYCKAEKCKSFFRKFHDCTVPRTERRENVTLACAVRRGCVRLAPEQQLLQAALPSFFERRMRKESDFMLWREDRPMRIALLGCGTVGGGVYMNAGAYGGEMKDVLVSVTYLTREGEIVTEDAANLDLSYRHSIFEENGGCILSAKFHLKRGDSAAIKARMDELMQKRVDKQPLDKPSAGSTFKRPVGAVAAALIDQCGLRGYRHGGAAVSEKHCGFVVNLGGATCADVLALCDEVRAVVKEKTGYDLEKEIRVVKA